MTNKIVSLSHSGDFTSARLNDIVLQIWHKETTMAGVASLRAAIAKVASESAAGLRLLVVVEAGAAMPPRNARASIAAFMTEFKSSIRATGLAFEGEGFRAASVRAVVTGLNMLTQHPFPYAVFRTVDQALEWEPMSPLPAMLTRELEVRAVQAFRRQLGRLAVAS
jgi:hypothetical protein